MFRARRAGAVLLACCGREVGAAVRGVVACRVVVARGEDRLAEVLTPLSVSYTHLTLPTILLV